MTRDFRAVLFDWRGTLFHDESDIDWIRNSAAAIGRELSDDQVRALAERLPAAADHSEVVAARASADCSADLHRAAVLLELRLAGFDDELAVAICATVTSRRQCHIRTPPVFYSSSRPAACELVSSVTSITTCVDSSLTTSWITLWTRKRCHSSMGSRSPIGGCSIWPARASDRRGHDPDGRRQSPSRRWAASVGMTTLILPPVPNSTPRGLDVVLRLVCPTS
jgi:hypothetical protein